jgi:hypothetical protein
MFPLLKPELKHKLWEGQTKAPTDVRSFRNMFHYTPSECLFLLLEPKKDVRLNIKPYKKYLRANTVINFDPMLFQTSSILYASPFAEVQSSLGDIHGTTE